ncbi:MAG TPA: PEP-CTERM sorting domain-containing protein, partial [Lacunisphaera sp.]|nr:PEP-CTERM sorting domain-containing protein [Lacunisphaera sp.]
AGQISLDTRTLTTAGAGNITLSGTITGSGGITKTGGGTLALSGGSGNSFGGALSITDGTVALAKSSGNALAGGVVNIGDGSGTAGSAVLRLDASHQIANHGGLVTIRSDGVLRVNNFTEGINTLAGTGLIDLSTSGYLTVGVNSGSSTFGGSITGSGTLEKAGSGTLTFNSNIGFTGTLALSGGTVALNGVSLSADTLIVSANSIIDFGGSASQLNLTNMAIAANVVLTIKNWAGAADFFFTQNWAGASFNTGGNNPMNQVVFQGFNANDTKWQSYDRQITPVPEPSAYGAMLLGMGVALSWIRRRRRRTA